MLVAPVLLKEVKVGDLSVRDVPAAVFPDNRLQGWAAWECPQFDRHLNAKGYIARGGQMVDASIVSVPKLKGRHSLRTLGPNCGAIWHGCMSYRNRLRRLSGTLQRIAKGLAASERAVRRPPRNETALRERSNSLSIKPACARFSRNSHKRRAVRGQLDMLCTAANQARSRIRARIEHVFGAQQTAPGGRLVRTIGIVWTRAKIGLQNFVYNVRRLATLERMAAA